MSPRRRLTADRLRLALSRALSVVAGGAFVPTFRWYALMRMDSDVRACRHACARARTAAAQRGGPHAHRPAVQRGHLRPPARGMLADPMRLTEK